MENLRSTEVLEALEAVDGRLRELEDTLQSLRRRVKEGEERIGLLEHEREHSMRWIAGLHLPPHDLDVSQVATLFADGLDACIHRRATALQPTKLELEQATEKQRILYEERRKLTSQISPVEVLPEELLVEIWKWVEALNYNKIPFPFIASWVTSRWRKVAMRNPGLWTSVHISCDRSFELVKRQVARSKLCSLVITVSFHVDCAVPISGNHKRLQDLMNIMLSCSDRWYSLEFGEYYALPEHDQAQMCTELMIGLLGNLSASHLRHLCIGTLGRFCTEPLFTGGTPALTHVKLEDVDIRANQNLLRGVTHLRLGCIPLQFRPTQSEFVGLLEACPALTNLALNVNCRLFVPSRGSVINAPSLRSLSFIFYAAYPKENRWISKFFGKMLMPQLQFLYLELSFESLQTFVAVMKLVTPSSRYPLLSTLSIELDDYEYPFSQRSALELLLLFPHIDHLGLYCTSQHLQYFLDALTSYIDASGRPPCPRLQTLTRDAYGEVDRPAIQTFITERESIGFPIVKLRVDKLYSYEGIEPVLTFVGWCQQHVSVEHYDRWLERDLNYAL